MYSDQPTIPSSVVILRNELARHPASQCRSSTLTIFIGVLLRGASAQTHSYHSAADSRPIPKSRKNLVTPAKAGAHTEHGSRPCAGKTRADCQNAPDQ